MAAVLGSWLTAWRIEVAADLGPGAVVVAVVMALTLSRTAQRASHHALPAWTRVLALPLIAIAAGQVGRLFQEHPTLGDAAFVVALSGAVWVRRYGLRWTALGTLVAATRLMLHTRIRISSTVMKPSTAQ